MADDAPSAATAAAAPAVGARRVPDWVWAALASLLLGIGLTWPLALHPTTRLAGHPGNDNWNHAWGYWWVAEELLAGRWPLRTDLLSFPRGGTLWFIDTVQVMLSLPLQLLGGPALAYNVVMILGLAFSGFGAWLLARRVTGDAAAAALAMVLYGASPHVLGQAYNGISETVCAGWLPLTLWCVLRVLDRPSLGRALALGGSAALCVLTSWYYGLFAVLGSVILLLWTAARQPRSLDWLRSTGRFAVAGVVSALLIIPGFLAFRATLEAEDALVTRDPEFVRASLLNHNITDLFAFFVPSKTASPDLFALYGEELIIVIYIGWVGLLLAGLALLLARRPREVAPWLWLVAVFFLFSLGPYLNIRGEYVELSGRRIPLPFLALFEAVPVFDRISHPFRFVTGVTLGLSMVAAHGFRHLLRKKVAPVRLGAVALLAGVILVEYALGSPAALPVPTSEARIPVAYTAMAEDPTPGAVLDLPLTVPNLERAVYVWYQTEHGRPVPWGLNDPMPASLLKNRFVTTLIRLEATRAQTLAPRLPELDLIVGSRALARQGYRYVVLHTDLYPAFKADQVHAVLTGAFGEGVAHPDDRLVVWTLQDPSS